MGRNNIGDIHEELGDVLPVLQRLHLETQEVAVKGLAANGVQNCYAMHVDGRPQLGQFCRGRNVFVHHSLK